MIAAGLETVSLFPQRNEFKISLDKFLIKKYLNIFSFKEVEEDFGTGKFAKYQKAIWDLLEHSESSLPAEVLLKFC